MFENTLGKNKQKGSRQDRQIDRKPSYEKEDYIKEEASYVRDRSYQDGYLNLRSDQRLKDSSFPKTEYSNTRGDIFEKKTDQQR